MQSLSAMAMPMVYSLGASGYPALQNFLSHIMDKRNRIFLLSSKKMFFVLLAALAIEMLEEVF
jgi:Trk-type K+ transport system membrane component